MIFGITGGSGAGKSAASDAFRELGIYVADADKAARIVTVKGSVCLEELRNALGDEILNDDGSYNRAATAKIVFSDPYKLALLNAVTHKYIHEYVLREIEESGAGIAAIDGAVIIGSPVERSCEFIVSVTADKEIRIKRIMRRDSIERDAAQKRIEAQPSDEFYAEHSRYVLTNNGSADELKAGVKWLTEKIRAEYRRHGMC